MTRKYFGTDGIRGRVGQAPLTPEFMLKLGNAVGRILAKNHKAPGRPGVVIGKDTRISGDMLESALQAGLLAAGVDVSLAGVIPTPAVAWLTCSLGLDAGIVVSASHNPYYDNGIKFFSAAGQKFPDTVEIAIETAMDEPLACTPPEHFGQAHRVVDASRRYIEFCKNSYPADLDLQGLRIVLDCAHGAGSSVGPKVLRELGADVVVIGAAPNGCNINLEVGATHTGALEKAVVLHQADLGIALDGDADRLIMVGASGQAFDGDQLLYVLALDRHQQSPVAGVVGTLMSNLALEKALEQHGIGFVRAKVGDRYVMEELARTGWELGGESSGHLIALDKQSTGDGLVAALAVLAAVRRSGQSLDALAGQLVMYPQKLINVPILKGFDWVASEVITAASARARAMLGDTGRLLIRASGTEPLLRVMVEGQNDVRVQEAAHLVAAAVCLAVA